MACCALRSSSSNYSEFALECDVTWGSTVGATPASGTVCASESVLFSRSYTVYGALLRLGVLPELKQSTELHRDDGEATVESEGSTSDGTDGSAGGCQLVLHVLGADGREGNTPQETSTVFAWLCQQLHVHSVAELRLLLIGPHTSPAMHNTTHSGLCGGDGSASLTIQCNDLYHECCGPAAASEPRWGTPTAAFCFNAGVWGYDSWLPTIAACCGPGSGVALVITSYNSHEAEDDRDALEDGEEEGRLLQPGGLQWLWGPEQNPFRSRQMREHSTVAGRLLADNHSWQCLAASDSPLTTEKSRRCATAS
eukprot:CAMPEP_0117685648 /NCGR_PEP_ID=MMETSP0804-20121206/21894_1 /TAXON_ID=1074897 /ORGANISM="Tetraselmis astigmatica, Strain CCMP880" /LENGTH=309 /DNA_ID=CAMNT_0005497019 /DNA_START=27 /DNA_END=956 /DNA_ORIENTATION=-